MIKRKAMGRAACLAILVSWSGSAWAQAPAAPAKLVLACDFDVAADGKVKDLDGRVVGEAVGDFKQEVQEVGPSLRFKRAAAITLPPTPELNLFDDFSVSFWVRADSFSGDRLHLVCRVGCWWILSDAPARTITVVFDHQTANGIQHERINSTSGLEIGQWFHIALAYGATGNRLALYVNGEKEAERADVHPLRPAPDTPIDVAGVRRESAFGFDGSMAQLRMYRGVLSEEEVRRLAVPDLDAGERRLAELSGRVRHPCLKKEVEAVRNRLAELREREAAGANVLRRLGGLISMGRLERLAGELAAAAAAPLAESPCLYYPVPALSPVMRLPTILPADGTIGDRVEAVAAPGEFEPASFVIYSFEDVTRLELKTTDLVSGQGRIPSGNVDIRIVKCWFQGNTAWNGLVPRLGWPCVLTPELLLHDETLIKVAVETNRNVANYIRVDKPGGSEYMWVREYAQPGMKSPKIPSSLFPEVFPVRDSPTLMPAGLTRNETKQFWITVKVPADLAEGVYTGKINLTADGQSLPPLTLAVRVLPFKLPSPRTYYDTGRDFYASFMGGGAPRSSRAQEPGPNSRTDAQLLAEYRNRFEHNDCHAHFAGDARDPESIRKVLTLRQAAGLPTRPLVSLASGVDGGLFFERQQDGPADYENYRKYLAGVFDIVEELYGHRDAFVDGCDEAPRWTVRRQVPFWRIAQSLGGRVFATGDDVNFREAGNVQDWLDRPGLPSRELAARWHMLGGIITMYAAPFAGAESPDLFRRHHGMLLYKADYDGSSNYVLYEKAGGFVWDDYYPGDYRAFCVVYPTIDGVIDTLAWEGYREAIDDVKYATLMKTLAEKALRGGDADSRQGAKQALRWLEGVDASAADLDGLRREMIGHILTLMGRPPLEAP